MEKTQGVQHRSKAFSKAAKYDGNMPDRIKNGVEAALPGPTAVNQRKFTLSDIRDQVSVMVGAGFYTRLDLGVVKYYFEIGAGKENFRRK